MFYVRVMIDQPSATLTLEFVLTANMEQKETHVNIVKPTFKNRDVINVFLVTMVTMIITLWDAKVYYILPSNKCQVFFFFK